MEEELNQVIIQELNFIENFPFNLSNSELDRLLLTINTYGTISSLEDKISLNNSQILALKKLRFGVVDSSDFTEITKNGLGISETNKNRIEYGGYIDSFGINLIYRGDNGLITNYSYDPTKINYHTHPYQVDKWCYAPPSEDDLSSLLTKSLEINKPIVCLVASAEGIYIYYPSQQLLDTEISESEHLNMYTVLREIKKLLGYVSKGIEGPKPKKRLILDDDDDNDENVPNIFENEGPTKALNFDMFGGNTPIRRIRSDITFNDRRISIETYLEAIRRIGFNIELYPYDEEAIPIPLPDLEDHIGGRRYKINYL